jgi:2-polyprenyl-3-methyl-5-hydroxy-6-metoxy-1,4-benzoquinol methylase
MTMNAIVLRQLCRFGLILGIGAGLLTVVMQFNLYNDKRVPHISISSETPIPVSFVRSIKGVLAQSNKQISPVTKSAIRIRMNTQHMFQEHLPTPSEVGQWSSSKLDSKLHHLSHWSHLDAQGWRAFVYKSIARLDPPMSRDSSFSYFELGVGVGAFSRRLLLEFPYATGVGVDLAQAAVDIAQALLPTDRMKLYVVLTTEYNMIGNNIFDYIIVPGVICYFPSLASVENVLRELVRIAKPSASMCFTMIPYEVDGKISCNLVILPSFWSQNSVKSLGIRVTSLQNMSEWNLPHSRSRYSVYLRKDSVV